MFRGDLGPERIQTVRDRSLSQRKFLRGSRRLRIAGESLVYGGSNVRGAFETKIPLVNLDPIAVRHKASDFTSLYLGGFFLVTALIIVVFSVVVAWGTDDFFLWQIMTMALSVFGIVTLLKYLNTSHDYVVYPNVMGGTEVTLFPNLPSPEEFAEFSAALEQAISQNKARLVPSGASIDAHVNALIRLGAITDELGAQILADHTPRTLM